MAAVKIYYFSGTGNSLYAAKELGQRLGEVELAPIVSLLGKNPIVPEARAIGFVFPIHLASLPPLIKDFIKNLDLGSVDYVFAIATRIGTQHAAFAGIDKVLKKKGRALDAFFNLNMPSNDPKFSFKELSAERLAIIEAAAQLELDRIASIIARREASRERDASYATRVPFVQLVAMLAGLMDGMEPGFYADEKCGGCGTCEKVCLSRKIKMENGRPVWQKGVKCSQCYACLNFCPNRAVQLKGYTEKKGRYNHPYATAEEIAAQK